MAFSMAFSRVPKSNVDQPMKLEVTQQDVLNEHVYTLEVTLEIKEEDLKVNCVFNFYFRVKITVC